MWDAGTTRALDGERYVDGVTIEYPKPLSPWHVNYVKKPFGNLGHRRVLVIANTRADAQAWAKVPGVTHVSDQTSAQYRYPNTPAVTFQRLSDR